MVAVDAEVKVDPVAAAEPQTEHKKSTQVGWIHLRRLEMLGSLSTEWNSGSLGLDSFVVVGMQAG